MPDSEYDCHQYGEHYDSDLDSTSDGDFDSASNHAALCHHRLNHTSACCHTVSSVDIRYTWS